MPAINFKAAGSRFVVLDMYRYIAAVGVFCFHATNLQNSPHVGYVGTYGEFVDMFFILSGFVIFYTHYDRIVSFRDCAAFMVKRITRIYPLQIVTLFAFVMYAISIEGRHLDYHLLEDFVVNVLLLNAWGFSTEMIFNAPSWSISGELACYLLFPLVAMAAVRLPIVISFATVAAAYIIGAHGHLPIWSNAHAQMYAANLDYGAIRALIGFANGVALCRLFIYLEWESKRFLPLGVGAMIAAILMMNVFAKPDLIILLFAVAILATALGERAFGGKMPYARALEWFGDTSYALYMLHSIVIVLVFMPLVARMKLTASIYSALMLLAVFVLTIVGHLVYVRFEVPAKRSIIRSFSPARSPSPVALPGSAA